MLKPSNFKIWPWGCVFQKSEAEQIALNIMVILARTGDEFRPLSWEEYKSERLRDGEYSDREKHYFDIVIPFCQSAESAKSFSYIWKNVKSDFTE